MPVRDTHKEYDENLPKWQVARHCADGSQAVKDQRTTYLPKPNPKDVSNENNARYNDYLLRANYVNFTGSTLDGLLGLVFRNDIVLELQPSIDYIEDDATGGGLTLDQAARRVVSDVLITGRYGLLVDYPEAEDDLSVADVSGMGLRAGISMYAPESIINWRYSTIGSMQVLSLVVLLEFVERVADDGYSVETQEQYRVLRLEDGIYTQTVINHKDEIVSYFIPTKSDGASWVEIPFQFVGAQNNDATPDKAPLYDIAEINLAHYRNSADFEESSFMVGQPTPVLSGLSQSWVDGVMKDGVILGSRRAILLPEGGEGSLLQANENTMPTKGMDIKEQQMVKIGARIIQDNSGVETAEAARIRFSGQNSKLGTVVGNVQTALMQALEWLGEFMGAAGESLVDINKEFYDTKADPQLIMAGIQLLDRGVIAKSDIRSSLRSQNMIDNERTDEDIESEAEVFL